MKKKNKYQIILLYLFFFPFFSALSFDDSDIFHEKVFLSAIKKSKYEKVSEMLQKKVSPNILDSDGLVPIAYSLANEDQKMFDLLIEAGAKINKTILDESSLLIFYINNKRFTMIEKLIENGADIHKQDSNGMTAMMHAIEKMNLNAVRILSTKKLDLSLTDFSGKTIFDYANRSRNLPIKRIIENLQSLSD